MLLPFNNAIPLFSHTKIHSSLPSWEQSSKFLIQYPEKYFNHWMFYMSSLHFSANLLLFNILHNKPLIFWTLFVASRFSILNYKFFRFNTHRLHLHCTGVRWLGNPLENVSKFFGNAQMNLLDGMGGYSNPKKWDLGCQIVSAASEELIKGYWQLLKKKWLPKPSGQEVLYIIWRSYQSVLDNLKRFLQEGWPFCNTSEEFKF